MKLSEAIRLGSMLRPPGRGGAMDGESRCALAAAAEAGGVTSRMGPCGPIVNYSGLEERWPILSEVVPMPAQWTKGGVLELYVSIYVLNDSGFWTREQIADWVESIERASETSSAVAQEAAAVVAPVPVAEKAVHAREKFLIHRF